MRGIDAVVLWIVCGWNRCSEPSQALRASSPGGRAKALSGASVCATMEGFVHAFASQVLWPVQRWKFSSMLLPLPPGEVPPEGRGRGMCRQFV